MAHRLEEIGATLSDRYSVVAEIGRGGMATVYRGRDLRHGSDVAIKVIRQELATAVTTKRFAREIRIASRLEHPNILPVLDSGEVGGLPYYVMPFIDGETLHQRLRREHRLPIDESVKLTGEIAEALSYAHAMGVVHRDIKPSNILLSSDHAIVTDFGIARHIAGLMSDPLTESGVTMGTVQYMSPEQGSEEAVDGRSDIYSLGCVLYEMLTGAPPFLGSSARAVIQRHRTEQVPSLRVTCAAVPIALEYAILKALAKAPEDRYTDPRDFKVAIERAAPRHRR